MKFNYKYSKSFNFQYSLEPLGKGLLIMKGIFFLQVLFLLWLNLQSYC